MERDESTVECYQSLDYELSQKSSEYVIHSHRYDCVILLVSQLLGILLLGHTHIMNTKANSSCALAR